jgi:hypothetical protein
MYDFIEHTMVQLVFADDNPLAYPFSRGVAARITAPDFGSTFAKDLTFNRSLQVSNTAAVSHHAFVRQSTAVEEVGRSTFTLRDDSSSEYSICTRRGGDGVMNNALQVDANSLTLGAFRLVHADGLLTIETRTEDDVWDVRCAFGNALN